MIAQSRRYYLGEIARESVKSLVKSMLRPVVRFTVRRAVPIQEFIEAAKELYVEETKLRMQQEDEKPSVMQVAVATGMHRRDVTRLFEPIESDSQDEPAGVLLKVLGSWENDKTFQNKSGSAAALSYSGKGNLFHVLVKSISRDVSPKSVLRELERLELVERIETDGEKRVQIRANAELLTTSDKEGMRQVAKDFESLGLAAYENYYARQDPPNLHARTEYDNIYVDSLPAVRQWFVDLGTEIHRRAREFLSEHDKDLNPDPTRKAGANVSFGTFSLSERSSEE